MRCLHAAARCIRPDSGCEVSRLRKQPFCRGAVGCSSRAETSAATSSMHLAGVTLARLAPCCNARHRSSSVCARQGMAHHGILRAAQSLLQREADTLAKALKDNPGFGLKVCRRALDSQGPSWCRPKGSPHEDFVPWVCNSTTATIGADEPAAVAGDGTLPGRRNSGTCGHSDQQR